MRQSVGDERGMTVPEIMVAAAVISIGLVALASAIPLAAYGIQEGNQLSTATFLANQRLEQIRTARWEASGVPVDTVGVSANADTAPAAGGLTTFPDEMPLPAPYTQYERQVRITDCGVGAGCAGIVDADMRQIVVAVSYRPMTGVGVAPVANRKAALVTMYLSRR